jgi:hypothetical protein
VEVTLTAEAGDGTTSKVSGTAETYEHALAQARKLVPVKQKKL